MRDAYVFFHFFLRFRAKGSRKARERCAKDVSTRAMSCPRSNISQWHFGCFHSFVQTTTDLSIVIIVCIRVCLIWYIWFLIRILDFGKCNPYGTAKDSRKICERGVLGNCYLAQPPHICSTTQATRAQDATISCAGGCPNRRFKGIRNS